MKPFVIPGKAPASAGSPELAAALDAVAAVKVKPFALPPKKKPPKTPDSVRQAKVKQELLDAGGKRVSINLTGEAVADVERITDRPGINTTTEAVIAALHHFARCKATAGKRRAKKPQGGTR